LPGPFTPTKTATFQTKEVLAVVLPAGTIKLGNALRAAVSQNAPTVPYPVRLPSFYTVKLLVGFIVHLRAGLHKLLSRLDLPRAPKSCVSASGSHSSASSGIAAAAPFAAAEGWLR
jgi:hypothetical protein